jgi:hypothetical protein
MAAIRGAVASGSTLAIIRLSECSVVSVRTGMIVV